MPDQFIHVIQSFSGDPDGALAWDPPIWSADGCFAPVLAQSLAARKAGVIVLRMALDEDGMPAGTGGCFVQGGTLGTGEIVSGYGSVPTSLVLRRPGAPAVTVDRAPRLAARLALSA